MREKPEDWIGYWINKIDRAMKNVHDKRFQEYDLTTSQKSILCQLWNKDGLTQKEIQENLCLKAASVSGLVDILLKKGFIYRKHDDEDARFKRLYLTEKGSELKDISITILKEIEDEVSQGFSDDERIIFISWMRKLYNNLNAIEK